VKLTSAHPHVIAKIDMDIKGELGKALMFIDQKPLKLLDSFAKKLSDLKGEVEGEIKLSFPVYHGLQKEEVDVEITAKGIDVSVDNVAPHLSVAQGNFDLVLNQDSMTLKGTARFNNDIQTSPVTWQREFYASGDSYIDKIETRFDVTPIFLSPYHQLAQINFQGRAPTEVIYKTYGDKRAEVQLNVNLTPASFQVDFLNYTKPVETAAQLSLKMQLAENNLQSIENLKLDGEGLLLEGRIMFDPEAQQLQSAEFSSFKFGRTDIKAVVKPLPQGFDIALTGTVLDAAGIINRQNNKTVIEGSKPLATNKKQAINLNVKADTLYTAEARRLENASLKMRLNEIGRLTYFDLTASAMAKPLIIFYGQEDAQKPYSLSVNFQDAGAALSVLGITQSVRGGSLIVKGTQSAMPNQTAYDIDGIAVLSNFRVKDAPILARLVSAISLAGIADLLSGDGVKFEKAETQIYLTSRIAPFEADQSLKKIAFVKGRTTGSELGLTFNGSLDLQNEFYDIEGTIVPVSTLNKIVSNLPIVGRILSGGSDAVFAATYKVKGSTTNPEVTVNPIAALAPGVLRKMFFE
jgi:hypothetical protein